MDSTLVKLPSEEIREVREMAEKVDVVNGPDCPPDDSSSDMILSDFLF